MDLTEPFVSNQAGGGTPTEEKTTDYFDFVVSPPPQCTTPDVAADAENFLHRTSCRTTLGYLGDARIHHDGFMKETNNNTLIALPPVSTITGSLGHINQHHGQQRSTRSHECPPTGSDTITMDTSGQDCDYWVTEDSKEQTCSILLEDLNKYCWSTQTGMSNEHHSGLLLHRRDTTLTDALQIQHRACSGDERQNTDGAIYTLTVLNSEANSMDGIECCKSPTPNTGTDGWSLRPNHLDLDAILNMEGNVNIAVNTETTTTDISDRDHDRQEGTVVDAYAAVSSSQFTQDEQGGAFAVTIKVEPGDNNNDWKLSDRNTLQEPVSVSESAAESLLRNALQGKLYSNTVQSSRILTDGTGTAQQSQEESLHGCADELLLSQLDVDTAYRAGDYEKLKNIANEVVESYCNLEPICNVSATTVMYTLDPAISLGTITLPADLTQVSTVTVVTTTPRQQDIHHQATLNTIWDRVNQMFKLSEMHEDEKLLMRIEGQSLFIIPESGEGYRTETRHTDTQPQQTNNQQQSTNSDQRSLSGNTGTVRPSIKPPKKYVRRANRNSTNGTAGSTGGSNSHSASSNGQQTSTGAGSSSNSPGSVQQRKERSLHYCSICSKGFKDKYSVNVHIRTHTGEKPFACSLCGKSFRQKAHLAKHYQTHVTQKSSVATTTSANITNNNSNPGNINSTSTNGSSSSTNTNAASIKREQSSTASDLPGTTSGTPQQPSILQQQQRQQQTTVPVDTSLSTPMCNSSS